MACHLYRYDDLYRPAMAILIGYPEGSSGKWLPNIGSPLTDWAVVASS
jgi:hypothetical protein